LFFLAHQLTKWGLGAWTFELPLIKRLEAIFYDTRLTLTMPRTTDSRIVIVDIDEKSLPRRKKAARDTGPGRANRMALLLDRLFDKYKVAIVGFDIVLRERDESSGIRVLQQLAKNELKDVPHVSVVIEAIAAATRV
jgi:adenylate cyclase